MPRYANMPILFLALGCLQPTASYNISDNPTYIDSLQTVPTGRTADRLGSTQPPRKQQPRQKRFRQHHHHTNAGNKIPAKRRPFTPSRQSQDMGIYAELTTDSIQRLLSKRCETTLLLLKRTRFVDTGSLDRDKPWRQTTRY
ncbi:hypothetical protein VTJ04DRAFT_6628 [Mycothermus thermophilus]|uniref:uncharacterized protein n=1 Tax=Humicola insolens TaxID=85995 RepID=UPI003743842C